MGDPGARFRRHERCRCAAGSRQNIFAVSALEGPAEIGRYRPHGLVLPGLLLDRRADRRLSASARWHAQAPEGRSHPRPTCPLHTTGARSDPVQHAFRGGGVALVHSPRHMKVRESDMMRRSFRSLSALLLALLLALLVGCSSLAVSLGLRVRLDKIPVTALSVSLVDKHGAPVTALGPGQSARLVVVATASDGKKYPSVGAGHGKVALYNYTIAAAVVSLGSRDTVSLSPDPRISDGKVGHLHIVPVAHPNVAADLDIPVRYDIAYSADFSGVDGTSGFDGIAGLDGSRGADGTPATTDPVTGATTQQGPGGNGTDGSNGGDGGNGGDGSPGQAIHIWVRMESGTKPLVQVKITGGGQPSFYLIDPNGGSLRIIDNGGRGGRGGQGGRGGRGGSGGSGFPTGFSGLDGRSGSDGRPGSGGAAGTIAISVDPAAQPFLRCITWSNRSGDGLEGPSAKISVESVAPLW